MTIQKYQDFSGSNPPPTAPSAYTYTKNEEPEIVFATVLYDTDTAIAADVAAESKILAPITQKTSKPPKNCPDGGTWGILLYNGEKTKSIACLACLCLGLLGLCVLACPQDEKDAYCVNGRVFDAAGNFIDTKSNVKFTPSKPKN